MPTCPCLYYWYDNRDCGYDNRCCFHCPSRAYCPSPNGCASGKAYKSPWQCKHYPVTEAEAKTIYTFASICNNHRNRGHVNYNEYYDAVIKFVKDKRKNMKRIEIVYEW